jgi:flagellar biosynthesis chaperone FliJ
MTKFKWTLQRLLDVTRTREDALRHELAMLAGQIARFEQEIASRQATVKAALVEMAAIDLLGRLSRQETFMRCAGTVEKSVRLLAGKVAQIQTQREALAQKFRTLRESRKALERLREESLAKHNKTQSGLEQKQFDQTAHVAIARRVLAAR